MVTTTLTSSALRPSVDGAALERIVAGDASAVDEVMAHFSPLVTGAARRVLGNSADVEDVKQETWMSLWSKADSIRHPECLGGWLWRTSRNHALRAARRRTRDVAMDPSSFAAGDGVEDDDAVDGLASSEACLALEQALESLTPLKRELIVLLFLAPTRSYAEVAVLAGRPVGSLGPTRRRILDKLKGHAAIIALMATADGSGCPRRTAKPGSVAAQALPTITVGVIDLTDASEGTDLEPTAAEVLLDDDDVAGARPVRELVGAVA